jgi:hypothetical protein
MSTAYFPTGMNPSFSGGYTQNSTKQNVPYSSWKSTGIKSNPIIYYPTHIRPNYNKSYGNIFSNGHVNPNPLQSYTLGYDNHFDVSTDWNLTDSPGYNQQIRSTLNRNVRSSTSTTLGRGGSSYVMKYLMEIPGGYITTNNLDPNKEISSGGKGISNYKPVSSLTDKPNSIDINGALCCNAEKNALRLNRSGSHKIKKTYYQTSNAYLYNRCQTYQQRIFNFVNGVIDKDLHQLILSNPNISYKMLMEANAGEPLALNNLYVAQCNPNYIIETSAEIQFIISLSKWLMQLELITVQQYEAIVVNNGQGLLYTSVKQLVNYLKSIMNQPNYNRLVEYLTMVDKQNNNNYNDPSINMFTGTNRECGRVYYKPNNPQFAQEGGVDCSTRTLKLQVDTIASTYNSIQNASTLKSKTSNDDCIFS